MFEKFWGTQFLILTLKFEIVSSERSEREKINFFKHLKWTKYLLSQNKLPEL